MGIKRRVGRKATTPDIKTANAIHELGGILEDTDKIETHAIEQKERLNSFIDKMSTNGGPAEVVDAIKDISSALDNETTIISKAKESYSDIKDGISIEGVSDKDKFELEHRALDLAISVMQASFNIGTILEDLDKARQTIVNSTTEEVKGA